MLKTSTNQVSHFVVFQVHYISTPEVGLLLSKAATLAICLRWCTHFSVMTYIFVDSHTRRDKGPGKNQIVYGEEVSFGGWWWGGLRRSSD